MQEVLGGSYSQTKGQQNKEAHHLLAWSSYKDVDSFGVSYSSGPCISMTRLDHQWTASWDSNKDAAEYIARQEYFLKQGDIRSAWMMEVKDLTSRFGTVYNEHIAKAEAQLLKLEQERKIDLENRFKVELLERRRVQSELEKARLEKDRQLEKQKQEELKMAFEKAQQDKLERVKSLEDAELKAAEAADKMKELALQAQHRRKEAAVLMRKAEQVKIDQMREKLREEALDKLRFAQERLERAKEVSVTVKAELTRIKELEAQSKMEETAQRAEAERQAAKVADRQRLEAERLKREAETIMRAQQALIARDLEVYQRSLSNDLRLGGPSL
jgi:hypothetical protein